TFTLLKVPGSSSFDDYVSFPFAIGGRTAGLQKLSTFGPDTVIFAWQTGQTGGHIEENSKGGAPVTTPLAAPTTIANAAESELTQSETERLFAAHAANMDRLRELYGHEFSSLNVG